MTRILNALGRKTFKERLVTGGKVGFSILNVYCIIHLVFDYVGTISVTAGPSMLPTLAVKGDVVLEDRISVHRNPTTFARGELITFKSPRDPLRIVCKRIIGLPGDVICVDPTGQYATSNQHVTIPKGHVWVTGDNMPYSRDSREYGPVSMGLIRGRVVARVLPLHRFTIFTSPIKHLGQ